MSDRAFTFKRGVTIAYLLIIHALAFAFIVERFVLPAISTPGHTAADIGDPTERSAIPTPLPVPSEFAEPPPANITAPTPAAAVLGEDVGLRLIIPVAGVTGDQLVDTFSAARAEGRVHEAIDIMAPAGSPVLAAADGKIVKFHESVPGGITIYELSADAKYVYYYAHLQRRADGLKEGDLVRQGTAIAYVGDTGNAGPGNYHLHFSLFAVTDPKNYWNGQNINPYPILKNAPK
ncbi:MAG TPA: peptidoglycan DD-metalloendopeptidase family protein [Pyrinomonadaceae bacterium]|nr:peptidoglycan DD-metalloendopeptidase family protein [Pyrinomonadaceae bacterium]